MLKYFFTFSFKILFNLSHFYYHKYQKFHPQISCINHTNDLNINSNHKYFLSLCPNFPIHKNIYVLLMDENKDFLCFIPSKFYFLQYFISNQLSIDSHLFGFFVHKKYIIDDYLNFNFQFQYISTRIKTKFDQPRINLIIFS